MYVILMETFAGKHLVEYKISMYHNIFWF